MAINPKIIVIPKPAIRVITGARVQGVGVRTVTGNLVDNTDPDNPIVDDAVSSDANNDAILGTDGLVFVPERVQSVSGDNVDNTDPLNPIIKSPANLSFYPTTAASDIPTYVKLVTNITDPDYDDPAVNVPTGTISGQNQLISRLAAVPGVFVGNPGVITISTVGEIRRTGGTGTAEFYFEAYHRNLAGTETLIGTSNLTSPISSLAYTQFDASLLLNNGVFTATDRLVLKFYGNRVAGGSNPTYDFLFGGTNPVRTLFPIPAGLLVQSGKIRREDWNSPYWYGAFAPFGTAESSPTWTITRVQYLSGGGVTVLHATGAWTNRYSLIYT